MEIGDRVFVRKGAGFLPSTGEFGYIIDSKDNRLYADPCCLCLQTNCIDWPEIQLDSGRIIMYVSECQMIPLESRYD